MRALSASRSTGQRTAPRERSAAMSAALVPAAASTASVCWPCVGGALRSVAGSPEPRESQWAVRGAYRAHGA